MRVSKYYRNMSSGLIVPFDSSSDITADRIMNTINEAREQYSLSVFKRARFKGVILSGFNTGFIKATDPQISVNMPLAVTWGDNITRWKIPFTIHEQHYGTDLAAIFTQFFGKSPLISGIPDDLMQERISRMPVAYTDIALSNYTNLHFGSIVNIYERNGSFFIGSGGGTVAVNPTTGGNGNNFYNGKDYKLDSTHYDSTVENLPPDYWIDILHKVIAEGRSGDRNRDGSLRDLLEPCVTGKTYRDFCTKVDGGNVGIAHFANRSLNSLLARMIRPPPDGYGVAKVEGWFGQKISHLKQVFPTCYMPYKSATTGKRVQKAGTNNCAQKFGWYVKGWNSFVAEYHKGTKEKALMIKIQQDTYRDTKVKDAEAIAKKHNIPTNMRNMAAILGIINSYGGWGNFHGKNPEAALDHYIKLKPGSHRIKRVKLIRETYPIKTSTPVTEFKKK